MSNPEQTDPASRAAQEAEWNARAAEMTHEMYQQRDAEAAARAPYVSPETRVTPPTPEDATEVMSGVIEEPVVAARGLAKWYTRQGLRDRTRRLTPTGIRDTLDQKADAAEKRPGVMRYVGQSIDMPTFDPDGPAGQAGWAGYRKPEIGKAGDPHNPVRPNSYRPTTGSEKRAANNLELIMERRRVANTERKYLMKHYGLQDTFDEEGRRTGVVSTKDGHSLDGAEKRHRRQIIRRVNKLGKKVDKSQAEFDRISGSGDSEASHQSYRGEVYRDWSGQLSQGIDRRQQAKARRQRQ